MSETTTNDDPNSIRHSWPNIIATLLRKESLSSEDTAWVMRETVAGRATSTQIAGFAIALRAKGETGDEVNGLVQEMLACAIRIELSPERGTEAVDVVGTGGDGAGTVNISTMAALVLAGAGVPVVKHGNRAASSRCGSADLLEELGVRIEMGPAELTQCIDEVGIGFCFAPRFHPGLRHVVGARRELGVPTVFNFLGPLTNPAQPRAGAIGCSDTRMAPVLAEVLAARDASALVMRGEDGLDEFTTAAPTKLWVVAKGAVRCTTVDARDLGVPRASATALRGGDARANAEAARRVFAGEPGPVRDAVVLNAAAGFAALGGFGDESDSAIEASLRGGMARANDAIDSGAVARVLERWVEFSQN